MSTCPKCGTHYAATVRFCTRDGAVLEDEASVEEQQIGRTLEGKYRLDAFLSGGGMGAVYRATHVMLGKAVAVKLIKPELVTSPEIARRFQREARAATHLSHPNIVAVHDLGQTEDGTLYIAMELVHGPSLKEVIRTTGPLEPRRIVHILRQVASALELAHRNNIVHRDLKPHNIMLARDNDGNEVAKLLDFGIAKTFDDAATQLTKTGFALGTPQYMSPEQALGKDVDGRSDLYSLGIILYEMLVGQVPFTDPSTPAVLIKHVNEPAPPPSGRRPDLAIPPGLEAMALRCLEKDPAQRFQTAEEFAAALDGVLESPGVSVTADAPTVVLPKPTAAGRETAAAVDRGAEHGAPAVSAPQPMAPVPLATVPTQAAPPVEAPAQKTVQQQAPAAPGTRPTVKTTAGELQAETAPAPAARSTRRRSVAVLIAAAAVVLLIAGIAGIVAIRLSFFGVPPQEGSQASPEKTGGAEEAPVAAPAMAGSAPGAPPPASAGAPPVAPKVEPPPATGRPAPAPPVSSRSAAGAPASRPVAGRQATPSPAPRTPEPALSPPLPENPPVLFRCAGAPEICSALRAAFDQALEKDGLLSVRSAERAEIVLEAIIAVLEERVEQQFGTTFVVRSYSVDLTGDAVRFDESVPMPPPTTFSFDARFGRERAIENARVIAGSAVEQVRDFWKKKKTP